MRYNEDEGRTGTYWLLFLIFVFAAVLILLQWELNHSPDSHQGIGGYQVYPDPIRTPGKANPEITQENLDRTICSPSYRTGSVRPSRDYTAKLKRQQIIEYGYKDKNPRSYQEDHLIPLWLGGHPTDPKNLWPQALNIELGAKDKDLVETFLHFEVCKKTMTLREAQRVIATDWVSAWKKAKALGYVDPFE